MDASNESELARISDTPPLPRATLDTLATLPDDDSPLGLVGHAWRSVQALGGDREGGKAIAQALADHWAPVGIADLVRRAIQTKGRDADRLWRPVLETAGAIGSATGHGGAVAPTVNIGQRLVLMHERRRTEAPAPTQESAPPPA